MEQTAEIYTDQNENENLISSTGLIAKHPAVVVLFPVDHNTTFKNTSITNKLTGLNNFHLK